MKKIDKVRRQVGMVFQHFNVSDDLRELHAGADVGAQDSQKQVEEIANHFLKRVTILEQANKYPGHLSGGQQQRVAIARLAKSNAVTDRSNKFTQPSLSQIADHGRLILVGGCRTRWLV
ncbi:ATP-binding cassette domain-containing protein [Mesorhizobium australicum]|uniref:ATP-binding cassette domain-containing protein n=1 Tax=Mesorhizobium australicum TaxID=536018 RepID=UPI0033358E46